MSARPSLRIVQSQCSAFNSKSAWFRVVVCTRLPLSGFEQRRTARLRSNPEAAAPRIRNPSAATPARSSRPARIQAPPPPAAIESRRPNQAERLLGEQTEIFLYRAPSHGSLLVNSALGGFIFTVYCTNVGLGVLAASSFSWLLKGPILGGCVLGISMGVGLLVTPARQLQSVRLVRNPDASVSLRFESKWGPWLLERKFFDAKLDEVSFDRNVASSLFTVYDVKLKDRVEWTKACTENPSLRPGNESSEGILSGVKTLWPTLKRDVRRMFAREGMVYVRIKEQNWKMDLYKCELLDLGRPFQSIVAEDNEVRDSFFGMFRRQFSSPQQ